MRALLKLRAQLSPPQLLLLSLLRRHSLLLSLLACKFLGLFLLRQCLLFGRAFCLQQKLCSRLLFFFDLDRQLNFRSVHVLAYHSTSRNSLYLCGGIFFDINLPQR